VLRLITRDPASGGELIVTRLECPESGVVIERQFSLGWIGRLTPDQLDFVGLLLLQRGNVQKVAADLGVSYNTARSRMDDIVRALGVSEVDQERPDHSEVLDRLAGGVISFEEAMSELGR
jgi:hypothetical protein